MRTLCILLALVVLSAVAYAQPTLRTKWLVHEPGTTMYVFRPEIPDEARVCVEITKGKVACTTAKLIRANAPK